MKTRMKIEFRILIMVITGIYFLMVQASAQENQQADRSAAPYFYIPDEDSGATSLPLKSTRADVNITGVIADVHLFQTYQNDGRNPIEAIYIFPASTRAAVYYMVMHIGEREITAVIQPRDLARQQYEAAKQNGQTASLLEQERPNVFTMNVANIMPGDEIKVELRYAELLIPENNIYTFVLPTVVGPRYTGANGADRQTGVWAANPYLPEGNQPNYTWDVSVDLSAGMPIQALRSPSHEIVTAYKGGKTASVTLKNKETFQGNRDFILDYRLAGNRIETGLLLYKGKDENFFLAMVQPPQRISPEMIQPREYIFVVDVSGSMHGFPLDISKKLMKDLISALGPNEKFNILTFAGSSTTFSGSSVPATEENKKKAIAFMNAQQGGGGTELMPAIHKAMNIPSQEGFARSFVILTDGYVTVEKEAFTYVRDHIGEANFFAFGIGSSVNRYIIEGIAHAGMGTPFVVTKQEEALPAAKRFKTYISSPLLTGVRITYKGFNAMEQVPEHLPDMLGERPLVFFGKWDGDPKGEIRISGNDHAFERVLNVADYRPGKEHQALAILWAREKIRLLDDFGGMKTDEQEVKEEITALGMKYNLMTRFTSFIALDTEIRNTSGHSTTVVQPLPLPEGVSNYAVGNLSASKRYSSTIQTSYGNNSPVVKGKLAEEEADAISVLPAVTEGTYTPPVFDGGITALEHYLARHLTIPESLKKTGKGGVVFVRVTIDKAGNVIHIEIIRSLHPDADKEAIRVIKTTSGMWKPASRNDQKEEGTVIIPVKFTF